MGSFSSSTLLAVETIEFSDKGHLKAINVRVCMCDLSVVLISALYSSPFNERGVALIGLINDKMCS